MKDILGELYRGKVRPFEKTMPQSQEYEELQKSASKKGSIFQEKLNQIDPALLDEYIALTEAETAADPYEFYQNFAVGFQLGARITTAVFTEK